MTGHPRVSILALTAAVLCAPHAARAQADVTPFPATYFAQFHPDSALDMVRRVPGFAFDAGDPSRRGMAEASGNVVIDGRRVADKTLGLSEVLARIPASQVDRIELVRSAPDIDMLGQTMVANVIRRGSASDRAALTVTEGLYLDGRSTPGFTFERSRTLADGRTVSFSASVSRYVETDKGHGWRLRQDGGGVRLEEADVEAFAGGATGYAQASSEMPGLRGDLRFNATATWTDYADHQEDRVFYPAPVISTLDEDLGGWAGGQAGMEAGVHLNRAFGRRLESESTISGRLGRKRYVSVLQSPGARTLFNLRDRTAEALARTQLRYQPSEPLALAFDLEVAFNRLDTASGLQFNDVLIPLPNGVAEVTEARWIAGVDATWKASTDLQLQAGVHRQQSELQSVSETQLSETYSFWEPDVRLAWSMSAGSDVRLRAARTVGQLDFSNFAAAANLDHGAVSAGASVLRPENAWFAEVAYEWRPASGVSLVATYRRSWLRDVIDRVPITGAGADVASFDAPGNIGSGSEDFADLKASLPLTMVLSNSELKLAATYRRTRVTDPTTGETRPVSGLKPFVITADFNKDLPQWSAAWGLRVDGGWTTRTYRYDQVETNRVSTLVTFFADWNPRPDLTLHLEAADVLGRDSDRIVEAFDGPRDDFGLAYRDVRTFHASRGLSTRLRLSF